MIDGNTDENGIPCPGGCLYSRPADRSDDFTNLAPRASACVWSASDVDHGLPVARARLSRAGGDRAVPPAAAAVDRGPRLRDDRRRRTWPALARRGGVARPRAVSHGQGRRDPARLGGIQRERRPHPAPRARVRGRLGIRRGLVAVGGRHVRAARVPLHRARRAGRADHLGQRHRHGAAGHPCAAAAPRRRPGSRPSWNGSGSARTGRMPRTRRATAATTSATCGLPIEPARNWLLSLRVTNLPTPPMRIARTSLSATTAIFRAAVAHTSLEIGWRKD